MQLNELAYACDQVRALRARGDANKDLCTWYAQRERLLDELLAEMKQKAEGVNC